MVQYCTTVYYKLQAERNTRSTTLVNPRLNVLTKKVLLKKESDYLISEKFSSSFASSFSSLFFLPAQPSVLCLLIFNIVNTKTIHCQILSIHLINILNYYPNFEAWGKTKEMIYTRRGLSVFIHAPTSMRHDISFFFHRAAKQNYNFDIALY